MNKEHHNETMLQRGCFRRVFVALSHGAGLCYHISMKIVIAGGTGMIGRAVVSRLAGEGNEVVLLSRTKAKGDSPPRGGLSPSVFFVGPWESQIDGADAVINLSGEPVAGKLWSPEFKARIVSSRVNSTRAMAEAIRRSSSKPKVFLNASAAGFYGNAAGQVTEESPSGKGFLAETCRAWEAEALKACQAGVRVVLLRTGLVLGRGGILEKMALPFKYFMGGPLGSGKQWMPWIHVEDEVRAIIHAIQDERLSGPVNLCSPHPVTMADFCKTLGQVMKRPSWLAVPSLMLRLIFREMADEMFLSGQNAYPEKLLRAGFKFKYPDLEEAIRAAVSVKR